MCLPQPSGKAVDERDQIGVELLLRTVDGGRALAACRSCAGDG
jgi:hypothetical protein